MASKNIYWIVLSALLLYIFVLAPRDNAPIKSTSRYVKQLIFGPYGDIEPYIICLFSFMGRSSAEIFPISICFFFL